MISLDCGGRALDLSRTAIMGILNTTPDSFSDGGRFVSRDAAIHHAFDMAKEGADIIDVGGESTRPGAEAVPVQEELDRVIPVIESITAEVEVPVSIDTSKPEVMTAAVQAGAGMINDVCALQLDGALDAASKAGVAVCLMHMQGEPRTMQTNPVYEDVCRDVFQFLQKRVKACIGAGIGKDAIVVDPGFGFGKTVDHNLDLLNGLGGFKALNCPILAGLSRKSFIGKILDLEVDERVYASVALALLAAQNGASIVRVHDVLATHDAVRMMEAAVEQRAKAK